MKYTVTFNKSINNIVTQYHVQVDDDIIQTEELAIETALQILLESEIITDVNEVTQSAIRTIF